MPMQHELSAHATEYEFLPWKLSVSGFSQRVKTARFRTKDSVENFTSSLRKHVFATWTQIISNLVQAMLEDWGFAITSSLEVDLGIVHVQCISGCGAQQPIKQPSRQQNCLSNAVEPTSITPMVVILRVWREGSGFKHQGNTVGELLAPMKLVLSHTEGRTCN